MTEAKPIVGIVDYGVGNLYSIKQAWEHSGLLPLVTSDRSALEGADAVLLPGVGAFGDAMQALNERDLVPVLQDLAAAGKPLLGICLGLQLLFTESHEFGTHAGLDLIPGTVERLPGGDDHRLKVPLVGWNAIQHGNHAWEGTPLEGVEEGTYLYFVHSYYVRPEDPEVVLTTSRFGDTTFCSSIQRANIFACQFHPERSGPLGLGIYRQMAALLSEGKLS